MYDWMKDAANYAELPANFEAFKKAPDSMTAGSRIGWWYEEDERFALENEMDIKECPPYTGVVVPRPDIEDGLGGRYDTEDLVVVMDVYPVEKCNCEVTYIAMRRLLNSEDLVRVVVLRRAD